MRPVGPRARGFSRRAFGALAAGAALARKSDVLPPETTRFADPTTEFPVFRLTRPDYASFLPSPPRRVFSRRGDFLILASERLGTPQVFRVEHKSGEWRQLTGVDNLDRDTVSLLPGDKSLCYMDGDVLRLARLSGAAARDREVYRIESGWERAGGVVVTEDGMSALLVESRPGNSRLRLVSIARGGAVTLAEDPAGIDDVLPCPRRASAAYRKGGDPALWIVDFEGKQKYRLQMAAGKPGDALWSPDGRSIFYLQIPAQPGKLVTLREFNPDAHTDTAVAPTTQFAAFSRNSDASVFVGASGSKASPYVLLLLRVTRREFTLAEHRASDPRMVAPVFSPTNERVYFTSDRDGRPCVYWMSVEKLVEKNDT